MPRRPGLPCGVRELLIEHRAVALPLDSKNEPPFLHRQALGEALEHTLGREESEVLRIHLNSFCPGVMPKGVLVSLAEVPASGCRRPRKPDQPLSGRRLPP